MGRWQINNKIDDNLILSAALTLTLKSTPPNSLGFL
jgi:hypothetical protein